jgi:O-antigen/teichoic acid export membrane protein
MADFDETEQALISAADLLFTTSPHLQALHEKRHPLVFRIHHGVSERFFLNLTEARTEYKRICYFGTLRRDIDYSAVNALAKAGYEVSLLGPEKETPPLLEPSVEISGMLSTVELIKRLKEFDAIILPYTDSKWNQGITPAKIYECLATGLPVIASDIPGLRPLAKDLYTAKKAKDFVSIIRNLPNTESKTRSQKRIDLAQKHSTSTQFGEISEKFEKAREQSHSRSAALPPILKLPPVIRSLFMGLTWITVFFSAAKAMTLITHVAAARILGANQYGLASVVLATTQIVLIPMMLGFPLALAHFPSQMESDHSRRRLIRTALTMFFIWSAACVTAVAAAVPFLSNLTGIASGPFVLALQLAALTAIHHTTSSALVGLTWFKKRGVSEVIYGLGVPILFTIAVALGFSHYYSFLACLGLSLCGASAYSMIQLRSHLRPDVHFNSLKIILPYTVIGTLNIISTAFVQSPGRFFLFKVFSAEMAGIYSAYFTATAQVALAFNTMIWAVLIPLASLPEGSQEAWKQFKRYGWHLFIGGVFLFLGIGFAAISLVGRDYPLHPAWIILFATAAALILVHGIAAALYAAQGTRGLTISVTGTLLAGLLNLTLNLAFVEDFGITGSAAALCIGYLFSIAWYSLWGWSESRRKNLPT